jgi:hypothetical protein
MSCPPLILIPFQSYSGSWKNGQWHGWGRLFSNDNSSVEGQFVENQLHGFGCRVDDEEGVVSYVMPCPPPFLIPLIDGKRVGYPGIALSLTNARMPRALQSTICLPSVPSSAPAAGVYQVLVLQPRGRRATVQ